MKKLTVSILIIAIILNLIQPIVLCSSETTTNNSYMGIINDGTANITTGAGEDKNTRQEPLFLSTTGTAIGANAIALVGNVIAFSITSVLTTVIKNFDITNTTGIFTIYDAVFNNIKLFDANYLLDNENNNEIHTKVKTAVANWYYTIRNIAIILSLCMLIYVGIRMAISTLANDKAKYQKMLIGWVQSFILIFFMHYIILISMVVSEKLLELVKSMNITNSVEITLYTSGVTSAWTKLGWDCVPDALLYWVMVFYQVKFFMLYIKRMLSVAFLIIISPLITVTYPIDKIGDGKAQAFSAWIKEYEVNMFIQPLHALLYAVFMVSAGIIAEKAPLLAVMFFMALSRGEKIVKGIFNARGMKSINSMGKGKKKK